MSENELLALLRTRVDAAPSMTRFAKSVGASPQYICDVLSRKRPPGPLILGILGVERKVSYEPVG